MLLGSLYFRGFRCFSDDWTVVPELKPVNIVIGRNNTGKSQYLEFMSTLCTGSGLSNDVEYKCEAILDEDSLRSAFPSNVTSGALQGNHWDDHGQKLIGSNVRWRVGNNQSLFDIEVEGIESPYGDLSTTARLSAVETILSKACHPLQGKNFRRILADRDIQPEPSRNELSLAATGAGATNIVRRFITSSSIHLPSAVVQEKLLQGLRHIFSADGEFTQIQIKQHDDRVAESANEGDWEIYLAEPHKGLVPLSNSGSGLKTVLLVLLNLLVLPVVDSEDTSSYIFAFEELENNLHPSLLRRLFQYLLDYAKENSIRILLTTHSSVAVDFFSLSPDAQIIHIEHNGKAALAKLVSAHLEHLSVVSQLGAKPSDFLQSNGIVWVEGPSDRIYINQWISIFSNGELQEGRDYQCAFYGGSLLARAQFVSPEVAEKELANLFRINPNIVVLCDSDKASKVNRIKERVRRVKSEVSLIPGAHIWITAGRDIENYLPGVIIQNALSLSSALRDPGQYELFFPRKGAASGSSYVESVIGRKTIDKMELAIQCCSYMDSSNMGSMLDLEHQVKQVISKIHAWNS
jgi:putative ATP-dependent endonuclease of OLD family